MVILGQHVLEWFDFIGKIDSLHKLEPGFSTVSIRSEPQSHSRFRHVPQDRFFALLSDLNLGYKQGLAYFLFLTWYREASIKHDKVFSLLSEELLGSVEHGLPIDYDIPWNELCIRAARASINIGRNLEILRIAGMSRRRRSPTTQRWDPNELPHLLAHPSWAPDWWLPPQQTRSLASLDYDKRDCFEDLEFCCPRQPPLQDLMNTTPFLVLRGVILGIINLHQEPRYHGGPMLVHPPPRCITVHEVVQGPEDEDNVIPKASMNSFVKGMDSHLLGDCFCVPFHERQAGRGNASFKKAPIISLHGGNVPKLRFGRECFPVQQFGRASNTAERAFPAEVLASSVESGDYLVLLEGGGVPFLLRPVKDAHGHIPTVDRYASFARKGQELPWDAAVFVLVGEASMCWNRLWPGRSARNQYCRAGTFVIV